MNFERGVVGEKLEAMGTDNTFEGVVGKEIGYREGHVDNKSIQSKTLFVRVGGGFGLEQVDRMGLCTCTCGWDYVHVHVDKPWKASSPYSWNFSTTHTHHVRDFVFSSNSFI